MSDSDEDMKDQTLTEDEPETKLDDALAGAVTNGEVAHSRSRSPSHPQDHNRTVKSRSTSHSPVKNVKKESGTSTPLGADGLEATIGGEVTVKIEPGKMPKLSRTTSQKVTARPAPLFLHEADKTEEACQGFQVIRDCEYQNKSLGLTEDEGLDEVQCECDEEYDAATKINHACGEDSDCINRATKIECIDDCKCGRNCQNKRFQHKQYAAVTVFQTEKKGYGLRADTDLRPNDFIFEYIGEVIGENAFTRRMRQYDEQGIKHFYFMSLNKGEFIDATKKGNLGRFCNHSCNPNCYVDKWVVGDKLRMGIFAERKIQVGEELTFNYNVDRYGADPQPCYCGEPNCTGFIGGRTQTERATKLSHATIEALGLEDGEDWDIAVAKKAKRSRKTGEADEEYVSDVKPKTLEEDAVAKVMGQLMQKKEKWIVVKLLERIQTARDEKVYTRVAKMHGYRILKSVLSTFMEDANVCLQVLDVLFKFPRITRNKIQDSKIEDVVEKLKSHDHDRVSKQATEILDIWSKLELGYRIPKKNPNDAGNNTPTLKEDWISRKRERTKSPSRSPPHGPAAPSGPRSNVPQRNQNFYRPPRPFAPRNPAPRQLPAGWHESKDPRGKVYYYDASGNTQWDFPTAAAAEPPPPPPKALTHQEKLQSIIDSLKPGLKPTPAATPQTPKEAPAPADKSRKWESLDSVEKQRQYDRKVIQPLVEDVQERYKGKMPPEEIKRLGKEVRGIVTKSHKQKGYIKGPPKLLEGTLKHKTVTHIREFFSKAHKKFIKHEQEKKARRRAKEGDAMAESTTPPGLPDSPKFDDDDVDADPDSVQDAGDVEEHNGSANGQLDPNQEKDTSPHDDMDEDGQSAHNIVIPMVPPPPPPRDDEDEDDETAIKEDEDPESFTEFKSPIDADMNTPTFELKRKLEDSDLLNDDIKAKKIKDLDDDALPKINGIHKSEDFSMDEVENDTYPKNVATDMDSTAVKEEVANGAEGDSR